MEIKKRIIKHPSGTKFIYFPVENDYKFIKFNLKKVKPNKYVGEIELLKELPENIVLVRKLIKNKGKEKRVYITRIAKDYNYITFKLQKIEKNLYFGEIELS
jgi:hypothetical protein